LKDEWRILDSDYELEDLLSKKFGISTLLAHLLANRAKNVKEAEELLFPDRIELGDPYKMAGMENAVFCLLKIKDSGQSLVIYGDYDVDGITGTALYYQLLKKWGWNVDYHIPNRLDDGYGLSKETIAKLASEGKKKILTVDCGITSVEEIRYANSIGCEVIITDHHEPKEVLPPAIAIVNPKCSEDHYSFKGFSGVGVAYKVLQAIQSKLEIEEDLSNYLDMVALGTIADIVPLLGENRYFVHKGLQLLSLKNRTGISKLMELSNVDFDNIKAHDVGFKIAPKINAVGRIDNANTAFQLMLENEPEMAQKLAEELIKKNQERQLIENDIYQQALAQIDLIDDIESKKILVLVGNNWHPGVIGIVASRLLSIYHRPTLMISVDGEMARGSARSVEGINIVEIFRQVGDLLEEFGGHKMAAGFSLKKDKINELTEKLNTIMQKYDKLLLKSEIQIDGVVNLNDINEIFISDIESLKPFGNGNSEPIFLMEDLLIEQIKPIGKSSFKMTFKSKDKRIEGIGFGLLDMTNGFRFSKDSRKADIVANVWKNTWNGLEKYELNIIDIDVKPSDKILSKHFNSKLSRTENSDPLLIVGAPNIVEEMVLEMSAKKQKLIVVCPTNSMLSDLYNIIHKEIKVSTTALGYVDALHPTVKNEKIIFTNVLSLPKIISNDSNMIVCEPQMMIHTKTFDNFFNTISRYNLSNLIFFSSFLNHDEETLLMGTVNNLKVRNEFKKQRIGVVDNREIVDKFQIIEESIESRLKIAIVFSNTQNLKSFSLKICKFYPEMCKSGEIISYISDFNDNHLLEAIKRGGKVNVLLTTSSWLPKVQLERIIYYDFPRNHVEFLKPPAMLRKESTSTVQIIFGKADVEENKKEIEEIFPSYDRVIESAKILKKFSGDPVEELVHSEIASTKGIAKVYLSILSEVGVFDGKNVSMIPTKEEILMTMREKEGALERISLNILENDLMNANVRNIARIFQNPFEIHEESSH